jgi:hypothetical protein
MISLENDYDNFTVIKQYHSICVIHIFSTGAALYRIIIISAIVTTIDNSMSACEIILLG